MTFTFLDVVFIILIFFIAIHASINGFVKEFFGKAAVILGVFIAVLFYKRLTPYLNQLIESQFLCSLLAFLLIFVVVYLLIKIIQHFVDNFFENDILGGLDHSMGFFLGIIEGLLLVSVVLIIIYAQPWFNVAQSLQGSFFNKILKGVLATPTNKVQRILTFSGYSLHGVFNV
jgi:membrane protein required for colicin V production